MTQLEPNKLYTTSAVAGMNLLPYKGLNGVRRCINAGYNGYKLQAMRVGESGHWRVRGEDLLAFLSAV